MIFFLSSFIEREESIYFFFICWGWKWMQEMEKYCWRVIFGSTAVSLLFRYLLFVLLKASIWKSFVKEYLMTYESLMLSISFYILIIPSGTHKMRSKEKKRTKFTLEFSLNWVLSLINQARKEEIFFLSKG